MEGEKMEKLAYLICQDNDLSTIAQRERDHRGPYAAGATDAYREVIILTKKNNN